MGIKTDEKGTGDGDKKWIILFDATLVEIDGGISVDDHPAH